ncbi:SDR family NAD(P)-dependent oxidoreductase [Herbidospora sp. RD11066]
MSRFTGKVVLITGAARGQGEAEARAFHAEGATVVIVDVLDDLGNDVVASLGERAWFAHLDVTNVDQWAALARRIEQDHGRLDVLVNNAGVAFRHGIEATSVDDWNRVMAINVTGPFLGMKHLVPLMKANGGAIVNIASMAGLTGHHTSAYSASKWALRGLTKTAALEFARFGVRVNAVNPGLIETPIVPGDTAFPEAVISLTPLARTGYPIDVQELVMFLASDAAGFITGEDFTVDGGLTSTGVFHEIARRVADTPH